MSTTSNPNYANKTDTAKSVDALVQQSRLALGRSGRAMNAPSVTRKHTSEDATRDGPSRDVLVGNSGETKWTAEQNDMKVDHRQTQTR